MKSSHFPQIYTLFDYFKEKVIFTPLFWEIFGKPRKNRYTEATGHTANDEQVILNRQGIHSEASAFKDMSIRMKITEMGIKVFVLFALEQV